MYIYELGLYWKIKCRSSGLSCFFYSTNNDRNVLQWMNKPRSKRKKNQIMFPKRTSVQCYTYSHLKRKISPRNLQCDVLFADRIVWPVNSDRSITLPLSIYETLALLNYELLLSRSLGKCLGSLMKPIVLNLAETIQTGFILQFIVAAVMLMQTA